MHQFGYVALRLADASIAYGAPTPSGEGFVIVIHVAHGDDGWSVHW